MEDLRIPELVRELRKRLDLTQEGLARRVGVTYGTVNAWENGRRVPQPFLLDRLLDLRTEVESAQEDPGTRPGGYVHVGPIREMVDRIVERFDPERVILFGSHARGDARPDSDVDLLVVMALQGTRRETQLRIRRTLRDIRVPKDVIVTTPTDYEWRRRVVGTVERPAYREGRVLYARG